MSHLPTELIMQTFLACKGHCEMGLTFSQVSCAWRNIAICTGTPQLWTDISMRFSESDLSDSQVCLLQAFCERSNSAIFNYSLSHWESVALFCIYSYATYATHGSHEFEHPTSMPCDYPLSLLSLNKCSGLPYPLTLFNSSWQLSTLLISGFYPEPQCLPSQIKTLGLNYITMPAQCLDVLLQCPNLRCFGLFMIDHCLMSTSPMPSLHT